MKLITHNERTWHATSAGTSYFADGQDNMSVRFFCPETGQEACGRLPGVSPDKFDNATEEQLRASLLGALSGADDSDSA